MSDTNPKHAPMDDVEFERYAYYGSESDPSVAYLAAEARRARDSEAALRSRVEALEKALRDLLHANGSGPKSCGHDFECVCPYDAARVLLSPRPESGSDGERR